MDGLEGKNVDWTSSAVKPSEFLVGDEEGDGTEDRDAILALRSAAEV